LAIFTGRSLLERKGASSGEVVRGIPPLSRGEYVAVMPMKTLGDEKTLGYVAEGIEDALAAKLFQLKEVHVASKAAAEDIAKKNMPPAKVAQALGVNLIVQGNVQGNGDKLVVMLTLTDLTAGGDSALFAGPRSSRACHKTCSPWKIRSMAIWQRRWR
jgi:TolB-like protein